MPSALPPGPWYAPFPHVYGPVFFYLSAAFIQLFGLSAVTARLVCVLGAALLVTATAWLMRAAGLGPRWAALGCVVMTLTPELGTIATNGRMDTLAIAIVIAAMAAVVAAVRADARRAVLAWGAVAGGLWLLAVLTQVRVLPILAGMGAGGAWLLVNRRTREPALLAGACGLIVFVAGGLWWMHQMGVTPAEWALTYLRSSRGDTQNVVLAGQSRVWGFELRNMMTLVAIVVAGAGSACMLLWGRASRMPDNERIEPALAAVLVAAIVNIAFIFSVANNVFTSSSYFVLPLLATVLAATAAISRRVVRPGAILAFWMAVARAVWRRPHREVHPGMADVGVPGSGSAASVRREVCPGWIAGFRL